MTKGNSVRAIVSFALACAAIASACTNAATETPVPVAHVQSVLLVAPDSLQVGQTWLIGAQILADLPERVRVEWTLSDSSLATLTIDTARAQGTLRPIAPGTLTVTVRANGVIATHSIRILPATPKVPPGPVAGDVAWTAVAAGAMHTCALDVVGDVYCWGSNGFNAFGVPFTLVQSPIPVRMAMPGPMIALSAGLSHMCAAGTDGGAYCWGDNTLWQTGQESTLPPPGSFPVVHVDLPTGIGSIVAVAAGTWHSCAVAASGEAACWGLDEEGQLGGPATTDLCVNFGGGAPYYCRRTAVRVGTAVRFAAIATGFGFTCGLATDGAAYCWGYTALGQGVAPTDTCRLAGRTGARLATVPCTRTPSLVAGGHRFVDISARDMRACGVRTDGAVLCWSGTDLPTPVAGVRDARSVSVGPSHACAVTTTGTVLCWGANDFGQLGVAAIDSSAAAVTALQPAWPATMVSAGVTHTCSVTATRQVMCWGDPRGGRLGRGGSPSS